MCNIFNMHCTSQYTKDTNNILSNYLIFHIFGAFSSKKIQFFTEKFGILPESNGIPFFKFEFTFRSENTGYRTRPGFVLKTKR